MKYLILLLIPFNVYAKDCHKKVTEDISYVKVQDKKSYLEGATITVTLKSGKSHTFPAEDYKVVRRLKSRKVVTLKEDLICERSTKHALLAFVGNGPERRPDISKSENSATVRVGRENYLGLQYQVELNNGLLIMGQGTTNSNFGLGLGIRLGNEK